MSLPFTPLCLTFRELSYYVALPKVLKIIFGLLYRHLFGEDPWLPARVVCVLDSAMCLQR